MLWPDGVEFDSTSKLLCISKVFFQVAVSEMFDLYIYQNTSVHAWHNGIQIFFENVLEHESHF